MTRGGVGRPVVSGLCLTAALLAGFSTHTLEASDDTAQTRVFRYLMGTAMRVEVYGGTPEDRQTAADEAFGAIAEVDRLMSDYRDDSELTAINRAAATRPVAISAPMLAVLDAAERIGVASDGAFDISVRPAHEPLGIQNTPTAYSNSGGARRPDGRSSTSATSCSIETRAPSVSRDRASRSISGASRRGSRRNWPPAAFAAAVSRAWSMPVETSIWLDCHRASRRGRLAFEDPARQGAMLGTIDLRGDLPDNLAGVAVSTSANSSNVLTSGTRTYGHLMDPRSLQPADASLSATVVSTDGTLADGLSKALFVLGPKNGLALLQQFPRTWGVVAYRKPDGTEGVAVSRGFESSFHPNDY